MGNAVSIRNPRALGAAPQLAAPQKLNEGIVAANSGTPAAEHGVTVSAKISSSSSFIRDLNQISSTLHMRMAEIKEANKVVNSQVKAAKQLKEAAAAGDSARLAAAGSELRSLELKRESLAKAVANGALESSGPLIKQLEQSDGSRVILTVEPVDLSAGPRLSDPVSDPAAAIDSVMNGLKDDLFSLSTQRAVLHQTHSALKGMLVAAKASPPAGIRESVATYREAHVLAGEVADRLANEAHTDQHGLLDRGSLSLLLT